jgi:ferric-dicitrate binding protein FerR (iron transport regulator)
MSDDLHDDLTIDVFERYCLGTLRQDEVTALDGWFRDHPDARAWYDQLRAGLTAGAPVAISTADKARHTAAILARVSAPAPTLRVVPPAASAVARRSPLLGRTHATWRAVTAITVAVAAVAAGLVIAIHGRAPRPVPLHTVATARGERATIRLVDGSVVTLGPQSRLRYDTEFRNGARDLYLDGEAYFTVSHQSSRPFTVYTPHSATRALGTAFLVKAYATDLGTEVVVADGKVALRQPRATATSGTTLVRGDAARIDTAGLVTVTHDADVNTSLEWTHGHLVFDRVSLGEMLPDLERWYNVHVVLQDRTMAAMQLRVSLDVESADQAIAQLADVSGLSWNRVGNTVTVSSTPAERENAERENAERENAKRENTRR